MDAVCEPLHVAIGDGLAGRAVDDDGVRQVLGAHVLREDLEVRRYGVRELVPRLPEAHRARVRDGADAQIEVELLLEDRRLRFELREESPAHEAGPHEADREHVVR